MALSRPIFIEPKCRKSMNSTTCDRKQVAYESEIVQRSHQRSVFYVDNQLRIHHDQTTANSLNSSISSN